MKTLSNSHFWITFLGEIVFSLVLVWISVAGNAAPLYALWILVTAHALNESLQAIASNVEDVYGSYENFVKDSRSDWRAFIHGGLLGLFVSYFIIGVLL